MHRNDPPSHDATHSAMSMAVKERGGRIRPRSSCIGPEGTGGNRSCVRAPVRLPDRRGRSRIGDRTCPWGFADRLLAVSASGIDATRRLTVVRST